MKILLLESDKCTQWSVWIYFMIKILLLEFENVSNDMFATRQKILKDSKICHGPNISLEKLY